jgi:hypothetical protein
MKISYLIMFLLLTSCQTLPQIAEIAVEEAIELEVHKEHGALNVSLDVKKEPTTQIERKVKDALNQERL